MPIKKAAFKAWRQNKTHAARNKKVMADIDALVKRVRQSVDATDTKKAQEWLAQLIKKVDRAVQKGVLKKNTAARKKSRLAAAIFALGKK